MSISPNPPSGHGWPRALFAALLSLVLPGLGQVHARAWRAGIVLLVLSQVIVVVIHLITRVLPPTPAAIWMIAGLVVVTLPIPFYAAFDAARRIRRRPPQPRPRWFRSTWFTAAAVLAVGLGLDAATPLGWQAFNIPSGSMMPTIEVGDSLFADTRGGAAVVRGDVVVFRHPRQPEVDYIKRVIGVAGDRVAVRKGVVVLNGTPLPQRPDGERIVESLPGGRGYTILKTTDAGPMNDTPEYLVPAAALFVMGDNRDNSQDSRMLNAVGYVPAGNVIGTAGTLYWATDRSRIFTPVR